MAIPCSFRFEHQGEVFAVVFDTIEAIASIIIFLECFILRSSIRKRTTGCGSYVVAFSASMFTPPTFIGGLGGASYKPTNAYACLPDL